MIRLAIAIVALGACLIAYGAITSLERIAREVRQKLARDRKPQILRRQVQGVTVHTEGGAR